MGTLMPPSVAVVTRAVTVRLYRIRSCLVDGMLMRSSAAAVPKSLDRVISADDRRDGDV
jgi:hypothetical protein